MSTEDAEKMIRSQISSATLDEPVYAVGQSEPIYYRKKARSEGKKLPKAEGKEARLLRRAVSILLLLEEAKA